MGGAPLIEDFVRVLEHLLVEKIFDRAAEHPQRPNLDSRHLKRDSMS